MSYVNEGIDELVGASAQEFKSLGEKSRFTTSIDAALTLAEDVTKLEIHTGLLKTHGAIVECFNGKVGISPLGKKTAALSVAIAALKSRQPLSHPERPE